MAGLNAFAGLDLAHLFLLALAVKCRVHIHDMRTVELDIGKEADQQKEDDKSHLKTL